MDWNNLSAYVNCNEDDYPFVEQCWTEAVALVTAYVGSQTVPQTILDRAALETGSELFHRRSAPNGVAQFAISPDVAPIRVARDPMVGAYPLLKKYMVVGI
ncbi:hypothetical protein OHB41_33130 [Streptomyces sp. NBC_01571]|uniref:hypothetical protein n=1 Tax=Streptomyces sp. NBC_01571 TaxID=2975883 RepID=UPI00225A2828|nr:hypothetical protein [Streptomyces sp. NBC_01571]MCX4577945.1 hypothetical protein [Streptomyces sp. NBC_01571]